MNHPTTPYSELLSVKSNVQARKAFKPKNQLNFGSRIQGSNHSYKPNTPVKKTDVVSSKQQKDLTYTNNYQVNNSCLKQQKDDHNLHYVSQIGSELVAAYFNLGNIFSNHQQWDKAIAKYRKALFLDPDHLPAYRNLAQALLKTGKSAEAQACFQKIQQLESNPKTTAEYLEIGHTLSEKHQEQSAIQYYLKTIEVDKNCGDAYFYLAKIYQHQGNLELALEYYSQAVECNDKNVTYLWRLAEILAKLQDYTNAIIYYQKVIQIIPNHWQAYYQLGSIFAQKKEWYTSLLAYQKVIKLQPNHFWSYNNAGNVCLELRIWHLAKEYYLQAIQIKSDESGWCHYYLGEACYQLEDWELAEIAYQKAQQLLPDLAEIAVKISQIQIAQENETESKQAIA